MCDEDEGEYTFVADGAVTCRITAALELTGGYIIVEKKKGSPVL